jgi:hypothetical protein
MDSAIKMSMVKSLAGLSQFSKQLRFICIEKTVYHQLVVHPVSPSPHDDLPVE